MFRKTKINIVFLKKMGEKEKEGKKQSKYEAIDSKKVNIEDKTVSFNDKTFVIPAEPSIIIKNTRYTFIDFDTEKIVAFHEIDLGYDAGWLDQFILKKLVAQLVSRIKNDLGTPDKSKWLTYILLLGVGALIGYTISEQMHMGAETAKFIIGVMQTWL